MEQAIPLKKEKPKTILRKRKGKNVPSESIPRQTGEKVRDNKNSLLNLDNSTRD